MGKLVIIFEKFSFWASFLVFLAEVENRAMDQVTGCGLKICRLKSLI